VGSTVAAQLWDVVLARICRHRDVRLARLFNAVNPLPNFAPTWNMAPTQDAMVVRHHPETGERHLVNVAPRSGCATAARVLSYARGWSMRPTAVAEFSKPSLDRQAEAIDRWRSTPVNGGNDAFLRLWSRP